MAKFDKTKVAKFDKTKVAKFDKTKVAKFDKTKVAKEIESSSKRFQKGIALEDLEARSRKLSFGCGLFFPS